MTNRQWIISILMASAVLSFVFTEIIVVQQAHAQTSTFVDQSFDNYSAFTSSWSGGSYGTGTTSGCFLNNCLIQQGSGGYDFYNTNLSPVGAGAISVYLKSIAAWSGSVVFQVCQQGDSNCSGPRLDYRFNPNTDGNWHQYTIAWQVNQSTGVYNLCFLEDDTNLADCTWTLSDSSSLPPSTVFTGLLITQDASFTGSQGLMIDELHTLSASFVINFNSIAPPPPFTLGTTSDSIAASSSLWGSLSLASSTLEQSCGTESITDPASYISVGICQVFSFLFVPSPTTVSQYYQLPTIIQGRAPVSWFQTLVSTWGSVSASSSANMADVVIPFHDLGIGSTTAMGNILPNITILSSTTITTYLSPNILGTLLFLESAAIWVLFAYFIYEDVVRRNRLLKQ